MLFPPHHRCQGRVFVGKQGIKLQIPSNGTNFVAILLLVNSPAIWEFTKMKVSLFSIVLGPGLCWRRGPTLTDLELTRHIPFFLLFFFTFEFFQVPIEIRLQSRPNPQTFCSKLDRIRCLFNPNGLQVFCGVLLFLL